MISYTMVGVADLDRAAAFYQPIFETMGLAQCWRDAQAVCWGDPDDTSSPRYFACLPFDGAPARPGNGVMTALRNRDAGEVAALHALALQHGGSDEGGPGLRERYGPTFYVAYVRDPDGNKLAFTCTLADPGSAENAADQRG